MKLCEEKSKMRIISERRDRTEYAWFKQQQQQQKAERSEIKKKRKKCTIHQRKKGK